MKLTELCEPLFQFVCRLNRSARIGTRHEMSQVRGEVNALLAEMSDHALSTPGLGDQCAKVRPSLIYFIDWMMYNSKHAFAKNWNNLAEEMRPPVFTGAEDFFTELNAAIEDFDRIPHSQKESRQAGEERLMIYHTALGFGFLGAMEDSPSELENKRRELATRLGIWGDRDDTEQLCKQAYEHTDESPLDLQPLPTIVPMVIGLIGALLILIIADIVLYTRVSGELLTALDKLSDDAKGAMVSSPPSK